MRLMSLAILAILGCTADVTHNFTNTEIIKIYSENTDNINDVWELEAVDSTIGEVTKLWLDKNPRQTRFYVNKFKDAHNE